MFDVILFSLIDFDDSVKLKSFIQNDATQMWEKGEADDEGYFTIINSHSKKVLTAISEHRLEIKGRQSCD